MATAASTPAAERAPCAMARAVSALTAPWAASVASGTAIIATFAALE